MVYQAYRPEIADYALVHGVFGGRFGFSRMSWVKPNFLWIMYRSSWATSKGQERVLGLRIRRTFFNRVLTGAVPSSEPREGYASRAAWQAAVAASDVRLQWPRLRVPTPRTKCLGALPARLPAKVVPSVPSVPRD